MNFVLFSAADGSVSSNVTQENENEKESEASTDSPTFVEQHNMAEDSDSEDPDHDTSLQSRRFCGGNDSKTAITNDRPPF